MVNIIVTGASGFVAKNTRKFLLANNHQVTSISRKNFKQFKNETKIVSRNYSEQDILPKIQNADFLFHLVGVGKQTVENDYYKINFEFTKNIIKLCKSAKIKNLIFLSGLGVSKDTTLGYFISKFKSEQEIINSGLNYTIFRPSFIIGKDDYLSKNLKRQIKQRKVLILGSGKFSIQPISIHDVLRIFNLVVTTRKFKNKVLDLVGPQITTYEKYVKLFSKNSNSSLKRISIEDAYYQAITKPNPPFDFDDLNLLLGNFTGDYKKLEKISGIKLRSVDKILESCSLP